MSRNVWLESVPNWYVVPRYDIPCALYRTGASRSDARRTGRDMWKVAPRGEPLEAHKRPPCDSSIERLIESPIPVPWLFVVKNGLKIWSFCSGSPTPVSLTDT